MIFGREQWVGLFLLVLCWFLCPERGWGALPNAEDRPYWTEKTCYREGEIVFSVGVATAKHSLEEARRDSFQAALWEISNFAQIKDTSLFLVETQMTYEEQDANGQYAVWRLVKIPFAMIEKAKKLLAGKQEATQNTVQRIKHLEKESRDDLADALRRALLTGEEPSGTFQSVKSMDRTFPTGSIESSKGRYSTDEKVLLTVRARDEAALSRVTFFIKDASVEKRWSPSGRVLERRVRFPASKLKPGRHVCSIEIEDAAGNISQKLGVFFVEDLHGELHDFLSKEFE